MPKEQVNPVAKIKINFRYDINKLKKTIFKSLRNAWMKKNTKFKKIHKLYSVESLKTMLKANDMAQWSGTCLASTKDPKSDPQHSQHLLVAKFMINLLTCKTFIKNMLKDIICLTFIKQQNKIQQGCASLLNCPP